MFMFVIILNAMKRISVLLTIVAAAFSVSAQDIVIDGNLCENESLKFKYSLANRYDTFSWTFGDGSAADNSIEPTHKFEAGTYTVKMTATKNGGESKTEEKTITVNAMPKTGFDVDTTAQRNTKVFTANSGASHNFTWNFGDGSTATGNKTEHTYSAPGIYNAILTTTDNQKCTDTTMRSVVIEASTQVPNVFTPNGDGQNDYFMISANGARLKLEIFNRWGYKMFSRTGTENIVWDGYNPQGTLVSPGTYFYVITVEEGSTNYNPLNGYITVFY